MWVKSLSTCFLTMCAAALLTTQTIATDGVISLKSGLALTHSDYNYLDQQKPQSFGGDARLSHYLSPKSSLQADLRSQGAYGYDYDEENGWIETLVGFHGTYRNNVCVYESWSFGGFCAKSINYSVDNGDELLRYNMIGAEALVTKNNRIFHLQGGFLFQDKPEDETENVEKGGFVRAVENYYFNPNTRVQAEVTYLHGSGGPVWYDTHVFTSTGWSAELAHKIGCSPFTGFIGYKGHYVTADDGRNSFSNHEIFLGFRVFFGTASIRDNEMRGAGLTLPDFSTPIGIGCELVNGSNFFP